MKVLKKGVLTALILVLLMTTVSASPLYVAGNPYGYPTEYYDKGEKRYLGIIPEVLDLVSEKTGIEFSYITNETDERQKIAENLQAEIISGVIVKDAEEAPEGFVPVFLAKDYMAGFCTTEITDKKTKEVIVAATEEIRNTQLEAILADFAGVSARPMSMWKTILVVCIMAVLFVLVMALYFMYSKAKKKLELSKLVDPSTGLGTIDFFHKKYAELVRDGVKALYYITYIAFDEEYVLRYYGKKECEYISQYAAKIFSEYSQYFEVCSKVSNTGFAVLFNASNDDDAIEKIKTLLEDINDGDILENRIRFRAGIGSVSDSVANSNTVLYNAQLCYYYALKQGKDFEMFEGNIVSETLDENQLSKDIKKALKNAEFKLYYQFILNLDNDKISGAEVLSRWEHPKRGLLLPGRYIGILERHKNITELDFYNFRNVCAQMAHWENTYMKDVRLSCNFTRYSICDEHFSDNVKEIAKNYNFNHSNVVIEITEQTIMDRPDIALLNIQELKKEGFLIAIDDFGSGYSSLSDLRDFPIDIVKIDRYILMGITSESGKKLLRGIVSLCHDMDKEVLCEGVETQEQMDFLKEINCNYAQGFLFSKVYPYEEAMEFYSRNSK